MNPALTAADLKKPARGDYRLQQLGKKRQRKLAEEKVMAAAVKRDHGKCRWPRCEYRGLKVGAAHLDHRGMGGNPWLDKTQRPKLIALCVKHHDQFDGRTIPEIDIQPVSVELGTDGPCVFYVRAVSGEWQHVATEKGIGISTTKGL